MQNNYHKFNNINFLINDSFTPNLTSELIYLAAKKFINENDNVLDLGCGSGAVGLSLLKDFQKFNLTLSDLSKGALQDVNQNALKNELKAKIIQSNVFENIDDKYDLIIDDISGISEKIADISEWFLNAPCDSGIDGLDLFEIVIRESTNFLKPNGIMIFPILSLSNVTKAKEIINKYYASYLSLEKKNWFLPDEIYLNHFAQLEKLKENGHINFENKFGKIIAYTEILYVKKSDSIFGE